MMDRKITGLLLLFFAAAVVMLFVGFGLFVFTGGEVGDIFSDLLKDDL